MGTRDWVLGTRDCCSQSKHAYFMRCLQTKNPVPSPQSPVPLILLFLLLVSSCSNITGKLLIIEANMLSSQGKFTESINKYTKALEFKDAEPYADYGLGTVYLSMGEYETALDNFEKAGNALAGQPPNQNHELRYRVCYNKGVTLFSMGNFSGAAESFRDALKADGRKTEAKRNLELSLLSTARQRISSGVHSDNEGMTALFDYIRQKELAQWTNREWQAEEDDEGPDY